MCRDLVVLLNVVLVGYDEESGIFEVEFYNGLVY